MVGVRSGLVGSEIGQKAFPNQGVWKTLWTSLLILSGGLIPGLSAAIVQIDEVNSTLMMALMFGLTNLLLNEVK